VRKDPVGSTSLREGGERRERRMVPREAQGGYGDFRSALKCGGKKVELGRVFLEFETGPIRGKRKKWQELNFPWGTKSKSLQGSG